MRVTRLPGVIVGAIALAACARVEAQVSLRPGLYERSFETEVSGAVARHKDDFCMTPEDAKDVVKMLAAAAEEAACTVSNVKTAAAGRLTFALTCRERGSESTYTHDVTYGPDWYTNVTKGKTAHGAIASKVNARRTGECPK